MNTYIVITDVWNVTIPNEVWTTFDGEFRWDHDDEYDEYIQAIKTYICEYFVRRGHDFEIDVRDVIKIVDKNKVESVGIPTFTFVPDDWKKH